MNKKTQDALDAQIEAQRVAQVVEVSEAPTLTSEIFDADDQESALVEVNFKDCSAWRVETSDAPKLTREVLKTKGKPVKTVEMFFDTKVHQVAVWDGIPLSVEIAYLKLFIEYGDQEGNKAAMDERDRAVANLLLGKLMADPDFSYQGEGEGPPIEARSSIMINALCNAFNEVNYPEADEIYQVTVRRGVPSDAFALSGGKTFEWYPVGKSKKYVDMPESELLALEASRSAERQVLVPKMILDPSLSYRNPEEIQKAKESDKEILDSEPYPVDLLSERYMKTFNEAHRVVNIPEAGLKSLQTFSRRGTPKRKRKKARRKPVGK